MNFKKALTGIIIVLFVMSCSLPDEQGDTVSFELVKIIDVDMPATMQLGQTQDIIITYEKPTQCHFFNGFQVVSENNDRRVSTVMNVLSSPACLPLIDVHETENLAFRPVNLGTFYFKFYTDINSNGEAIYLERTILVQ